MTKAETSPNATEAPSEEVTSRFAAVGQAAVSAVACDQIAGHEDEGPEAMPGHVREVWHVPGGSAYVYRPNRLTTQEIVEYEVNAATSQIDDPAEREDQRTKFRLILERDGVHQ
jgi:hypothetical protein